MWKNFGSLSKSKVMSSKVMSSAMTKGMRAEMAKKVSKMAKKKKY